PPPRRARRRLARRQRHPRDAWHGCVSRTGGNGARCRKALLGRRRTRSPEVPSTPPHPRAVDARNDHGGIRHMDITYTVQPAGPKARVLRTEGPTTTVTTCDAALAATLVTELNRLVEFGLWTASAAVEADGQVC